MLCPKCGSNMTRFDTSCSICPYKLGNWWHDLSRRILEAVSLFIVILAVPVALGLVLAVTQTGSEFSTFIKVFVSISVPYLFGRIALALWWVFGVNTKLPSRRVLLDDLAACFALFALVALVVQGLFPSEWSSSGPKSCEFFRVTDEGKLCLQIGSWSDDPLPSVFSALYLLVYVAERFRKKGHGMSVPASSALALGLFVAGVYQLLHASAQNGPGLSYVVYLLGFLVCVLGIAMLERAGRKPETNLFSKSSWSYSDQEFVRKLQADRHMEAEIAERRADMLKTTQVTESERHD